MYRDTKIRINQRPYRNYPIYRDRNTGIRFSGGHIEIMLFIEVEKLEFFGSHNVIIRDRNTRFRYLELELDSPAAILLSYYL